jgi:hypothetical protein
VKRTLSIFLLAVICNLLVFPASAADRIIVDQIAKSDAENLELQIPEDTPPGPGQVTIEITNADGSVAGTGYADFCKDLDGVINWNSPCSNITPIASLTELEAVVNRENLPNYDPAQEPIKNGKSILAGLAALALMGSTTKDDEEEREKEELEFVEGGELQDVEAEAQWGDDSNIWRRRYTELVDAFFLTLARKTAPNSPLFARKLSDGAYLRAMIGSIATFVYPIALLLGIFAVASVKFQAIPPKWSLIAALLFVATLDGFAGLIAASIFFIGTLVSGNITMRSEIMTVLGVCLLMIAPPLIASSIRPLRRVKDSDKLWERLTDYALITLLSGWTVKNIVGSLNSLAHTQFAITYYANKLGLFVAVAVLIRLALEDLAVRAFPVRLAAVTPEKVSPTQLSIRISKIWKFYIFFVVASAFVGFNIKLVIGTFIYFLPMIIDQIGFKFEHRYGLLYWLTPKGTFKIVAMIFIGGFFALWMQSLFHSPRAYLAWSFAVLTIPGFIFKLFALFGKKPAEDWKQNPRGQWIYRIGGVGVFLLLVLMVKGVDLFAAFKSLIGM